MGFEKIALRSRFKTIRNESFHEADSPETRRINIKFDKKKNKKTTRQLYSHTHIILI